ADRIRAFANAQRRSFQDLTTAVRGGSAGHTLEPVRCAGCYAPGGRFPLPSSVLMTAIPARCAGVEEVWVASPRPTQVTLAAAAVADADAVLAVGGAQAIAALAYGAGRVPACDAVVGPGSVWVTAAKQLVAGRVAIDMLAGPSELVVVADAASNPRWIAADLLAQAEHDPRAVPILVATDAKLADAVDAELESQLKNLPTAGIARQALDNGFTVVAVNTDMAIDICNRLAPEHLAVFLEGAEDLRGRFLHYGALFLGGQTPEAFGDYGLGPNHVLPTGGTARSTGGLSVLTFLRARTWLKIEDAQAASEFARDAAALARLEGLEAHARSAEHRLS
ncbi:MAG: histidinol dehydrogenase, partial [Planctomycetota bacterium]